MDLDKINNSVAVDETSNFKGTIDQIKFKGTTLLIIENGQIKEAYEGADTIIDYLRSLNS